MAIANSNTVVSCSTSSEFLCTPSEDTVAGAVDYKQRPAIRSKTGRWRSAAYIIGVEMAERMAFYGVQSNLINFLTEKLGQSTATAAANVNAWSGVTSLLPVLGAVVADSCLGKYYTVIVASLLYILGLGLLTVSAMLPSLNCITHGKSITSTTGCSSHLQTTFFFGALYLVAFGQSGHKPCVQAFGANQFDGEDPSESRSKTSFFNWWYFGLALGGLLGIGALSYIQDNLSWSLGFGIPCIIMVIALLLFGLGTFNYRFIKKSERQSPFLRIGRVFLRATWNRHAMRFVLQDEEEALLIKAHHNSQQFRFLDEGLLTPDVSKVEKAAITQRDVDEANGLLRLSPIWAACLIFGIVFAQIPTFFIKQGVTLDRSIGSSFKIPAASLQCFIGICIIVIIPIYDRVLVPVVKKFTGKPTGISPLQRIGTGILISILCMVVAGFVERRRLEIALKHELIDLPNMVVPMSIWWLLPQYVLFGVSDVFTLVGLQEFFYDQVPVELRSVGLSLYLSVLGIGSLLSSALIALINKLTSGDGMKMSWFADNLNHGHLDYFYWLLAVLRTIGFVLFVFFSRSYIYTINRVHV